MISELGGKTLDLAFIDGMHHFEFALRDFINVEKYCSADSIILIHDVYPIDATERRSRTGFAVLERRYLALDSNIEKVSARSDGQRDRVAPNGVGDRAKCGPAIPCTCRASARDHR